MPITLPDLPKGKEFEELVSAHFQASGLYVERNIAHREKGEELLELDVITTDYDTTPPKIRPHELKSGGWGFPDIFKLRGWIDYLDYLDLPDALLIVNDTKTAIEFIKERARQLSIDIVVVDDLKEMAAILAPYVPDQNINEADVALWRFSYWVERKMLHHLSDLKSDHRDRKAYPALSKYYYDVSSGIFFTKNIVDRVQTLYDAFIEHPHISAKCACESLGGRFDDDNDVIPRNMYTKTYHDCSYTDVQISTFIEHRARLAILKSAVDLLLCGKAGKTEKIARDYVKLAGKTFTTLDFLPQSFRDGMQEIARHKYFHRYPVFWQWFLWFFGGFILKDHEEEEYELLAEKTGIPIEEIPNAFAAYEILFPLKGGWLVDVPSLHIRLMKLFSVCFMGIGSNLRRYLYSENETFETLKVSGPHTLDSLIKWNNLTVTVLRT